VVAIPSRSWRPFAAPAAFLAAVTLAVVGARALWPHHTARATQPVRHQAKATATAPAAPRYYRVRAGDTLAAIAVRTKTPVARLRSLNPAVQPTALFIGQRLRLR
jgi:LysM repeat protein